MAILSPVSSKTLPQRCFVAFLYIVLSIMGMTMAIPFLITLTGSATNVLDYDRFGLLPRSLWSREDRYMKALATNVNGFPNWFAYLKDDFNGVPANWTSWRTIGADYTHIDKVAAYYLDGIEKNAAQWGTQAKDYSDFVLSHPIEDTEASFTNEAAASFVADYYEGLALARDAKEGIRSRNVEQEGLRLLSNAWEVPVADYFAISFIGETRSPLGMQSWGPPSNEKWADFLRLKFALLHGFSTPGIEAKWQKWLDQKGIAKGDEARKFPIAPQSSDAVKTEWAAFAREFMPGGAIRPFSMRRVWLNFLDSEAVRRTLGLKGGEVFDIKRYNALAGTEFVDFKETPFPIPSEGFNGLRPLWEQFQQERYPLRLVTLQDTPELRSLYVKFLQKNPNIASVNKMLGTNYAEWSDFPLALTMPSNPDQRALWIDFARGVPLSLKAFTSAEASWQSFLKDRYSSLEALNKAYGWNLQSWEQATFPYAAAFTQTFVKNERAFAWEPLLSNYHIVSKFLLTKGNSIPVTLWLIILSILTTLTVNPIAGYALSRFNLSGKDKIILFCIATSAFPAMVSAIPGYLLMRDLGLLNTFFALVLPGAANGMSIFILKGFFDSLPQELYEAATIDGAKEWQIFSFITLPMVKPILAINALNAFLAAYSGWEWALIICQDQKMWTLSVWLYQASQWWSVSPWITTAGFIVASIPTLIVFLFCQNIIMRGIIVPSMK